MLSLLKSNRTIVAMGNNTYNNSVFIKTKVVFYLEYFQCFSPVIKLHHAVALDEQKFVPTLLATGLTLSGAMNTSTSWSTHRLELQSPAHAALTNVRIMDSVLSTSKKEMFSRIRIRGGFHFLVGRKTIMIFIVFTHKKRHPTRIWTLRQK